MAYIAGYPRPTSPAPTAGVPTPPAPPAWLTPSTSTTTYGSTASGTAGNIPPPVIPAFPGGQQAFVNPADALQQLQALLPPPPMVQAPVVQASQIQVPGGSYDAYRDSLYQSQFAPVQRELSRQAGIADENAAGMLAQAGLADSGTGVGQRLDVAREYDQRIGDASSDISAAATASTEAARFNILTANAQLEQQANLANAGFDYQSQVANATNLLTNNNALASGYLQALGISGQQASAWTNSYLNYFSEAERNKIMKDQALQQFHGEWLNYLVQKEKLSADVDFQGKQLSLQQRELQQQEELARLEIEQQNQVLAQDTAFKNRSLGLDAANMLGQIPSSSPLDPQWVLNSYQNALAQSGFGAPSTPQQSGNNNYSPFATGYASSPYGF